MSASPVAALRKTWQTLSPLPGGKTLFSRVFGFLVPYSGTVKPQVEELRPGYARLRMHERRSVRNHLRSVHAIALMNLAEATSGLAMNFGLPDEARAIVTRLEMTYLKKARGTLVSECLCAIPDARFDQELVIEASIKDAQGDVVALAAVTWKIGPRPTA